MSPEVDEHLDNIKPDLTHMYSQASPDAYISFMCDSEYRLCEHIASLVHTVLNTYKGNGFGFILRL